jgi:hypothetical protein
MVYQDILFPQQWKEQPSIEESVRLFEALNFISRFKFTILKRGFNLPF